MKTNLLLVSTCGTSLFTNGATTDERKWLTKVANRPVLADGDAQKLKEKAHLCRELLMDADSAERHRLSAELNGIGSVLDRWSWSQVQHLLIHTDTAAGRGAADILHDTLVNDGHQVQLLTASGLRTDDPASFREALAEITGKIEEWIPGYRERGWTTLFNLTGGFKSINAYLQALGMLHADRCVFLFEGSPALMEIPRLPVRLAEADEVKEHLSVFRRLALGYRVGEDEVSGVPEALVLVDEGQATTSVWGDMVWMRVRKKLLGEELLAPLTQKLVLKDAVRREFGSLDEARRVQVNRTLDALSAHLDGVRPLLKSNTLKKLKGNPVPPSTHEIYLWSDGAAGRLLGHYEGGQFIANMLHPHL